MSPINHLSLDEEQHLFPPTTLNDKVKALAPKGFAIRPLMVGDYAKDYLQTLAELTVVGDISAEQFREQFLWMKQRAGEYFVVVLEDESTGKVAATGTLLVEHKFIHKLGKVGHIEDIVVSEKYRGKSFGKVIIETLKELSLTVGCYKTILCCLEKNVGFYEKCGLVPKEVSMAIYFPSNEK